MRVEQLEETFGDQIEVEWKSFLLRPDNDGGDPAKHDAFVEYTNSWMRPAAAEPSLTFSVWATDNAQPTGSIPAQIAQKAMEEFAPEAAAAYHRRLMDAYFAENRTISDAEVLADLAADVDVDPAGFITHVVEHEQRLARAVIDEHNSAIESGVTAVPTIVLDDVLPVQGAQDFESYVRWIDRLLSRRGDG